MPPPPPSMPRPSKWSLSFSVRHHKQLSKRNQNVASVFNYNFACEFCLVMKFSPRERQRTNAVANGDNYTTTRFVVCYLVKIIGSTECVLVDSPHRSIDTLHIEMASPSQICGGCNALTCCCPPETRAGLGGASCLAFSSGDKCSRVE
jgi:hypothetical protein